MSQSRLETAFILAGGKGMRMRRLGELLPKCSLVAYDQPLLVRQIESCRKSGVDDVYVSISPESESIVRSILKSLSKEMSIHVLLDEEGTGPIPALRSASKQLRDRGSLFFLGDIYLEHDDFACHAGTNGADALILDTQIQPDIDLIQAGCNVRVDGDRITEICEKPAREAIVGNICWTGVSYLPPSFFSYVDKLEQQGKISSLTHIGDLYQLALREGLPITHFGEKGAVVNLTTPDDLLLINCLEFRKICRAHPDENKETWGKAVKIFSEQ